MTAPKAKTLQARFGFSDPELTTPKHDAIMLWLDANIDQVLADVIEPVKSWKKREDYVWSLGQGLENVKSSFLAMESQWPSVPHNPELVNKIWEKPIVDKQYTIGFVDMMVVYTKPFVLVNLPNISICHQKYHAYFEVKPSIPSLGEVIRQIRMYQTYTNTDFLHSYNRYDAFIECPEWFIVSPDDRFAEQLRDQGIGFVKVPNTL